MRGLARGGSLSTIRRRHDRDAMLSVRRGESDPYAMAPMPTPQADLEARAEPAWASPVPPPSRLGTRRDSEPLPQQEPAWATAPRARGRDSTERVGDVSVRRLSYTPGASEDPLAPDETPQSALEVVVPDSMV